VKEGAPESRARDRPASSSQRAGYSRRVDALYGLVNAHLDNSDRVEVVVLDVSRDDAERALTAGHRDEPGWEGQLPLVEIDLSGPSLANELNSRWRP
jgi:hypothetical protein